MKELNVSIKLSVIFALLCILVGIYAGRCIFDKPIKQNETIVKQEEKKSGTITKKTTIKPDGTKQIDEVETYLSDRKNESVSVFKKTTWSIIPKYNFENNMFSYYGSKSKIVYYYPPPKPPSKWVIKITKYQ